MKNLQEIVDSKAKDKLEKELSELFNFVWNKNYHLFKDSKLYINIGTEEKPKDINIGYIFAKDGFYQKLFDANIERYKEKEALEFMKKVEDLQSQIDDLYGR